MQGSNGDTDTEGNRLIDTGWGGVREEEGGMNAE